MPERSQRTTFELAADGSFLGAQRDQPARIFQVMFHLPVSQLFSLQRPCTLINHHQHRSMLTAFHSAESAVGKQAR